MILRKTDVGKVGRSAGKKGLVLDAKPGEAGPPFNHEQGTHTAHASAAWSQGRDEHE